MAPLKVCSGTQANTTDYPFLRVVGNSMILVGFNIGPKSELLVLVVIKILVHDYILWGINIQYSIFQWLLIETAPHKPYQFNNYSSSEILEWGSSDQCSCTLLDYAVIAFNISHMLICGGGINIRFLRE